MIRESAQLWVERFYWWGQLERLVRFAEYIQNQPDAFFIRAEEDIAILGNVCARWTDAQAMLHGYDPTVVEKAQTILERLPLLADCTVQQALARARLFTSIGYQFRLGGLLAQATAQYVKAQAAFRKSKDHLKDYWDEYAMLLNNLAFAYAKQGRMVLARPLAHEALRINEEMGHEYSTGLALSTLASIAQMRGNYSSAVTYGEEALTLFRELEDAHGTVLAYLSIAKARRRMAKHELEKGRKLEEARQRLEEARLSLNNALDIATRAELGSDLPVLYAEQGRVYRELGHITTRLEGLDKGIVYYHRSEEQLHLALKVKGWGKIERADTLQDLAEVFFDIGDQKTAQEHLTQVEELIGPEYRIVPGEPESGKDLPREYFAPLGKVEMLRGQMSFEQGQLVKGLQHYILAYAYFVRFSPDAVEKDTMVEYLYNHLREAPVEQRRGALEDVRVWARLHSMGVDVEPFLEILGNLLGT